MAASQQLFYCFRPPLDRMLGEGNLMLVCLLKVSLDSLDGCIAATILLFPAPTGQDARGGDSNANTPKESVLMAASQQPFYYMRPLLDRMLGGRILMLVDMKFCFDGCFTAAFSSYPVPQKISDIFQPGNQFLTMSKVKFLTLSKEGFLTFSKVNF